MRSLERTLGPHLRLELTPASDGRAGLELLLHAPEFDACLSDAEMPVMNGYDMVTAARAAGSATPIIGITGNALPEDVQRFIDAGVQDVMVKPVRVPRLVDILRAVLPAKLAAVPPIDAATD